MFILRIGVVTFRRHLALAMAAVLAVFMFLAAPLAIGPFGAAPAHADDDDDGGGGGFSSGGNASSFGGGGKRWFKKPRRFKKAKRWRGGGRRAASRVAAWPDMVAIDLPGDALAELERRGYRVIESDTLLAIGAGIYRLRPPRRVSAAAARQTILAVGARAADANTLYYRPQMARCRGCKQWPVPAATFGACQGSPLIGIVDTRIATDHAALKGQKIETVTLRRSSERPSHADHGTAIAALLVGASGSETPGILPAARLIAIDPYRRAGRGDRADAYDVARAIDLLVARRPAAINLSLAGPANDILKLAVAEGSSDGIPIIAAAGNNGPKAAPLFPAAYEQVSAVTAIDSDGRPYRRAAQGAHIDFAAPGVGIEVAATRGRARVSGTSFAAPFIAAAYAAARDPTRLVGDAGAPGRDPVFGHGVLDPARICEPFAG